MSLPLARYPGRPEPTPWALGLTVAGVLAAFSAGVMVGIFELIDSFSELAAISSIAIVAVGLGGTLWDLRTQAVWRWITWGTTIGLVGGFGCAAILAFTHG
ncbi:DUF2537 domain-containing protein [Gordonia asplenii]|uniref:DUF2537 domain-containing protein n=1 Tax=Gordonia asplenii TaxID=2725283 RepID=UPI0028A65FC9|nr:DUF2537 domain-containing protein [Gordonia asplenii]